jgi:hypothetical protein
MKYAVEMGSGDVIYTPTFIKTGSHIQKLMCGWDTQRDKLYGDRVSLLLLFQSKKIG